MKRTGLSCVRDVTVALWTCARARSIARAPPLQYISAFWWWWDGWCVVVISRARAWFGLFRAPFSVQWCADLLPRFSIVVACFGISMDRFESWSSVFYCKRFCYCRRFVAFVYITFFFPDCLLWFLYAHEHMSVWARASERARTHNRATQSEHTHSIRSVSVYSRCISWEYCNLSERALALDFAI